jgi:2-iminobutanoate/2-iminopropanoate deaminase
MAMSFNPPEVWQPFGAFALAAVQGEGRPVHLKGQVALDRDGRLVGKGDMRAQVRQVLENYARSSPASAARWATSSP